MAQLVNFMRNDKITVQFMPWLLCLGLLVASVGCSVTRPTESADQASVSGIKPTINNPASYGARLAQGYSNLEAGKYRLALIDFDLALVDAEIQAGSSVSAPQLSTCTALEDAKKQIDPLPLAEIYSASGYALYLLHLLTPEQANEADQTLMNFAEPRLTCALELAIEAKNSSLEGRIRAYLGLVYARLSQDMSLEATYAEKDGRQEEKKRNLEFENKYRQQALAQFQKSQYLAKASGDSALVYATELQLAKLESNPAKRLTMLKQVDANLSGIADIPSRVNLMLNIMDQLNDMQKDAKPQNQKTDNCEPSIQTKRLVDRANPYADAKLESQPRDTSQFECAVAERSNVLARQANMLRALSQGEGFLADCHERAGKLDEAVRQTESAIRHSVEAKSPDLTMNWQSKLGRLMALECRYDDAMMAYRRAMFYVDEIRNDIPMVYADGQSSYSETLEPIYRGLADLLLRSASTKPTQEDRQSLLLEGIFSLEKLKQSELEDYFNARCSLQAEAEDDKTPKQSPINGLSPLSTVGGLNDLDKTLRKATGKTAILYPIIFDKRLELMLVHDGIIKQFPSVKVSKEEINHEAEKLNKQLNDGDKDNQGKENKEWKSTSQKLYQWLVKPLRSELQSNGIDRIIYIPDGKLRLAPISAFYDDEDKSYVAEHYAIVINNGLLFSNSEHEKSAMGKSLLAGLSNPDGDSIDQLPPDHQDLWVKQEATGKTPRRGSPEFRTTLVNAMSLENVRKEIDSLNGMLDSKPMLNEIFTHRNLEEDLLTGDYEIIHIASHGHFGHTASHSYIMTYDKNLQIDEVQKVMHMKPGHNNQLELVTFSACETATGDDRAPLGFSGIAIKAKARNALGALWPVDDEATYQLMKKFYTALKANEGDKAAALQQAQKGMIEDKLQPHSHPFFWSPFILVGSW